jgi:hypothetical protein
MPPAATCVTVSNACWGISAAQAIGGYAELGVRGSGATVTAPRPGSDSDRVDGARSLEPVRRALSDELSNRVWWAREYPDRLSRYCTTTTVTVAWQSGAGR